MDIANIIDQCWKLMESQDATIFYSILVYFKVFYGRRAFKLLKQFREKNFTFSFFHCFHSALFKWIMPTWEKIILSVKETR